MPHRPTQLVRLALALCNPAWRIEALRQGADQRSEVRFKALELGGTDLSLPLTAQLIEDRFTLSQYIEAKFRDLKTFAATVKGVRIACHIPAFLQHPDRFRRRLL